MQRRMSIYHVVLPNWHPAGLNQRLGMDASGSAFRQTQRLLWYLQSLGVTCVYLTGILLRGRVGVKGNGSPFAIADHYAIDPQWGTVDELQDLLAEGKSRGLKFATDLVFNHTALDAPLVQNAPDFYVQCARPSCSTDEHCFSVPGSTRRICRGGYSVINQHGQMESATYADTLQLDLSKDSVQSYLIGSARWLRQLGFSVFRIDMACKLLTKNFRYGWQRETQILQRLRTDLPEIVLLTEAYQDLDDLAALGSDVIYSPGWCNSLLEVRRQWSPEAVEKLQRQMSLMPNAKIGERAAPLRFPGTHDQSPARLRGFARGAMALTLASPHMLVVGGTELDYAGWGPWLRKPDPITWGTRIQWTRRRGTHVQASNADLLQLHAEIHDGDKPEITPLGNGDHIVGCLVKKLKFGCAILTNPNPHRNRFAGTDGLPSLELAPWEAKVVHC